MIFKKRRFFRGLSVVLSLFCALFFSAEMVATSSSDYKSMVDGIFGETGAIAGSADSYSFQSEYKTTTEMVTRRAEIATQIAEEGCVLLKNDNNALPLKNGTDEEVKVTMLGSRAYTYNSSGDLRDTVGGKIYSFYAGITGSHIMERQTVTLTSGKLDLPVTPEYAFNNAGIKVNPSGVKVYSNKAFPTYVSGSEANGSMGAPYAVNEPEVKAEDFDNTSEYKDACLVVIGRSSGEGREYLPGSYGVKDKNDGSKSALHLSDSERNLIREANKISDNVIVLINSAVAMEIDELKYNEELGEDHPDNALAKMADAVLWIGIPGVYGMLGVANVLAGKASPSGHLSNVYAVDASASPAAQNFGITSPTGEGHDEAYFASNPTADGTYTWNNLSFYTKADNAHYVVLAEGLYTGYYYYETRYMDTVENKGNAKSAVGAGRNATNGWEYKNEVSYSFGYGLSYTTFTQELVANENGQIFTYNPEDDSVTVQVKVTNTGNYPAKDVVQLYAHSPYTAYDIAHGVEKAGIQLLNFGKTDVLYPADQADGETKPNSQTLTITADLKYLASYDKTATHDGKTGGYIIENADYYFAIGNGAHEAINNVLLAKDAGNADKLYLDHGVSADASKAIKWNPAQESALTDKQNGSFDSNGVNVSLFSTGADGYAVENQLADADYNFFKPNTVTYLTRNDWAGTFPKSYLKLERTDAMTKYLGTNENNGGRVYEFTSGGSTTVNFGVDHSEDEDINGEPLKNMVIAEMKGASYDDSNWDYLLEQITFDEAWQFSPYGGAYCEAFVSVNAPMVWQIDGPSGNVTARLGDRSPASGYLGVSDKDPNVNYRATDMPCEPMVAATFNQELLEEQGEIYGEESLWSRSAIMWAPGMNLHRTPFNSRNHEYYSEDPMLTNLCGTAFVRGGLSKGIILSAKHFAFNTQESFREGLTQFMEEQSARELELRGFQGLTQDVNYVNDKGNVVQALGLMTSFSRIGVCGVNAHTGLMKNILRGEWGYKGLSSTDMVVGGRFFNPQDSVINNVTFMATSNASNLLRNEWATEYNDKNKVRNDANLCNALYENMHYYMYAIANSNALNGYSTDMVVAVQSTMSNWEKMLIGLGITFGVLGLGAMTVYVVFAMKEKKEPAQSDTDGEAQE